MRIYATCADQNNNCTYRTCTSRSDSQCTGGTTCMVVHCYTHYKVYYPVGYNYATCHENIADYTSWCGRNSWVMSQSEPCKSHLLCPAFQEPDIQYWVNCCTFPPACNEGSHLFCNFG